MQRTKTAIIYSFLAILIIGMVGFGHVVAKKALEPSPTPVIVQEVVPNSPTVAELFKLVNEERAKVGVAPLVLDERLNRSAQEKADDMNANNYNDHVDANGRHGYDIAHEYAPDICIKPSENLYWGNTAEFQSSSKGAVDWWMTSKAHHDAMLSANNIYVGFGVSGVKVVTHFC